MKVKQLLTYNLAFLLLLAGFTSQSSGKQQIEKRKVVDKNYTVSATTELRITNKFGDIEINTWDKNEFGIKVEIVGKGKNADRAQSILDAIELDIDEGSSEISFSTDIEKMKNKNNEGFEINYTISMPEDNPLYIKNSFGDVSMGDRNSDLDITVAYGSMKVGNVNGTTDLKLSFGSGNISNMNNGNVTVKYSDFEIGIANSLDLEQSFSKIEIESVNVLELKSKYGSVEIEKANIIDADVHFSGFEIDELTGELELDCSYIGDFKIRRLAKTFTLVDIEGKFGSYEIGIEPGLNADIEAEFSFADLKVYSDIDATFHYRVKEHNKSVYKGIIGKGDNSKRIRIDSGYGNLRLKQD